MLNFKQYIDLIVLKRSTSEPQFVYKIYAYKNKCVYIYVRIRNIVQTWLFLLVNLYYKKHWLSCKYIYIYIYIMYH